jgi:hypothetical protein
VSGNDIRAAIGDCGEEESDHHQSSYAILTFAGVRNVLIPQSY